MAVESDPNTRLLRTQKVLLIDILSADADFVLQHAHSRGLLSSHGYQQVKACRTQTGKVTDLLDHIIQRGPGAAQGYLELLKDEALQEAFPRLNELQEEKTWTGEEETLRKRSHKKRKRKKTADSEEGIPPKVNHSRGELQCIYARLYT